MKKCGWAIFLFALSLTLHLIKLGNFPTFISDEASIGYNAFSLLKTGRDEWGNQLPLTFKAFGEHKLPLYIYFSVLPISFLGLNQLATRFVSAAFGAMSVLFFINIVTSMGLGRKKNYVFIMAASFLYVINPWHIQTSRMALEANLGLFFFLAGFTFFLKESFCLSALFFVLTLIFKNKPLKKIWPATLIFVVLLIPLVLSGFRGSSERFLKVSIFTDPGVVARIEEKRLNCLGHFNYLFCRLVYNRPAGESLSGIKPDYLVPSSNGQTAFVVYDLTYRQNDK
ncbi:MAG TPA: hypothetical protein VMW41_05310 [Candidatus Bathyarchaeia archaeon]|nr:hypothetical protein [Candidatus Bathyarchaeia archaeon]